MDRTIVGYQEQDRLQHGNLRLEELQAANRLQLQVGQHRPTSTKNTWAGKQKEFQDWNRNKGYPDDFITESKFLLFLSEIKDRAPYKRGRKRLPSELISPSETENRQSEHLSWHTLDGYVNAIMDLWRFQHMLGKYPANFPVPVRPPSIKEFLKNAKKDVVETRERCIC